MSADTWEIVGAIILTMGMVWGVIGGLWWLCAGDPAIRENRRLTKAEQRAQWIRKNRVVRRVK